MKLPEFTRSTTLRWTLVVASIFAAFVVALLGFVYLKTKNDLTMRSDRMIASQMSLYAHLSQERRLDAIDEDLKQDPGRVQPQSCRLLLGGDAAGQRAGDQAGRRRGERPRASRTHR